MLEPEYSIIEVLGNVWWIGAVAFAVSLIATPLVRFIAYRKQIVDKPDNLLKPHGHAVAYLGGVAICLGLLAGLACYLTVMPDGQAYLAALAEDLAAFEVKSVMANPVWNLIAIAISSILITVVGLVDDIREISPRKKVLGQVLAAGILLAGGVGIKAAEVVLQPLLLPDSLWLLLPLSSLMCVVMVIATCNATNLLDGLDGLCGGVTGIIALGFLALAVWLAMWAWPGHLDRDYLRVGLSLAMAGAVLGFLPYNIPPASIFMGDAGSMLLGFFVATMMILFCTEGNTRWFIAAWVVFALPTLDTSLAVVRRLISRKGIFTGDRSHLYDQLVDRGMTVRKVVVLFYILSILAAVIGVGAAIFMRGRHALVMYVLMFLAIFVLFYRLGMVTPEIKDSSDTGPSDEKQED